MIPHSADFAEIINRSHQMVTRADLLRDGVAVEQFDIIDGEVSVDCKAAIRRQATVTLVDPTGRFVPSQPGDAFSGYGTEMQLWRGVKFPDGTEELLSMGIFTVRGATVSDTGTDIKIEVKGFDRARTVSRARFLDTWPTLGGWPYVPNLGQVIEQILASRYPRVRYATNLQIALPMDAPDVVFDRTDDPWASIVKLANDHGADIYFDYKGEVMADFPDYTRTDFDFQYVEGENGNLLYFTRDNDNDTAYNHFVVTGESTNANTPAVWAEAKDDNPTSPTYYLGDYGDVPSFYSSPMITTQDQAQAVANKHLIDRLGVMESVHMTSLVNPAQDCCDIVRFVRERAKLDGNYTVDTLSIPMVATRGMDMSTRQKVLQP